MSSSLEFCLWLFPVWVLAAFIRIPSKMLNTPEDILALLIIAAAFDGAVYCAIQAVLVLK